MSIMEDVKVGVPNIDENGQDFSNVNNDILQDNGNQHELEINENRYVFKSKNQRKCRL